MNKPRRYYSVRTGKHDPTLKIDLPLLRRLFKDLYVKFDAKSYFQEVFGYYCVDEGDVPGKLGSDIEAQMFLRIQKRNLCPILVAYENYSEDDIFDVIEFLYDHISKPLDGWYHSYNGCGWHYNTFNVDDGRQEYRAEINNLLCDYEDGYELSAEGEILVLSDKELENLFQSNLPTYDPENIESRVKNAIGKLRRSRSSMEDRRGAIRDLADVLEFMRPKLKQVLTKQDESDIFNIANRFGVRHHNDSQKTDYDKGIWYSWMFYYYLATIHASVRLIEKYEKESTT